MSGRRKRAEWKKERKRVSSRARHRASELILPPPMKAPRGKLSIGSKREGGRARERAPWARKKEAKKRQQFKKSINISPSFHRLSLSLASASFPRLSRTPMESSSIEREAGAG